MFFRLVPYIIPCDECRESFLCIIKENPVDKYLGNRIKLIYWLYIIHNKVNSKLNTVEKNEISFKIMYLFYFLRFKRAN